MSKKPRESGWEARAVVMGWLARGAAVVWRSPSLVLIALVRLYQLAISPWLGNNCRFHPSCSQYFIGAVQKYGALRGSWKGVGRILRCHPWHPGGIDPP